MATKTVKRYFGSFKGVDNSSFAMSADPMTFSDAMNVQFSPAGSLEGRKGRQPCAQASYVGAPGGQFSQPPAFGIFNHQYRDPVTGQKKTKLIGVGDTLYEIVTGSFTVGYTGAGSATFSHRYNSTTGLWTFDLKVGTASCAGFPMNCGVSEGDSNFVSFKTLRNAINSVANFYAHVTPGAVVNGNQSSRSLVSAAIAVYNAYSSTAQPNTITVSTTQPTLVYQRNLISTNSDEWYFVGASSGTSLSAYRMSALPSTSYGVTALDEFGAGLFSAHLLGMREETLTAGADVVTMYFEYWQPIPAPVWDKAFYGLAPTSTNRLYKKNHTFVNSNNVTYISTPFSLGSDPYNLSRPETGLLKYDGNGVYQAGMPQCKIIAVTSGGAGSLTGRYRYLARFKYTDVQGVSVFGNESTFSGEPAPITLSSELTKLTISTVYGNTYTHFDVVLGAFSNAGTQAGTAATEWTTSAPVPNLRVGSYIIFLDSTDNFRRYKVTSFKGGGAGSTYQMKLDIPAADGTITIKNAAPISSSIEIELYRTKAGGNVFYKVADIPNDGNSASLTYYDDLVDASLGIQYEGTNIGALRRDLPPPIDNLTIHQGLLVGKQIPTVANTSEANDETVVFSNGESLEYFPVLTNQLFVPGRQACGISAISSDTSNNLLVFKDSSFFNVTGSLAEFNFTVSESSGGNAGCPSQHSIQKIGDITFFLSLEGPKAIKDGSLIEIPNPMDVYLNSVDRVKAGSATGETDDYNSEPWLDFTTSVYDEGNGRYYLFLNAPDNESSSNLSFKQTVLVMVYDIKRRAWLPERSTPFGAIGAATHQAGGGSAYYNGTVYQLGQTISSAVSSTYAFGSLVKAPRYGTIEDYLDGSDWIEQFVKTQWDYGKDPRQDKTFQDLSVITMPIEAIGNRALNNSSYYSRGEKPPTDSDAFTLYVYAYKNFRDGYRGVEESALYATKSIDIGATTPMTFWDLPNPPTKATAMIYKFGTNVGHFFLSGFQYTVIESFGKDGNAFEK